MQEDGYVISDFISGYDVYIYIYRERQTDRQREREKEREKHIRNNKRERYHTFP